jgi:Flp pilus assembly protein TadG
MKPTYAMPQMNRSRVFPRTLTKQRGVAAIEFALVAPVFFLIFFGIVEVARAMYICNTLQEVTRRAAALAVKTDFSVATAMNQVREKAIFRDTPGGLFFAEPITDQHVKIDYLYIPSTVNAGQSMGGVLPASPLANRVNCSTNPNASNCIRLVRVRICMPGGGSDSCDPVTYQSLVSFVPLPFPLPIATTIAPVETLGLPPGMPCGC